MILSDKSIREKIKNGNISIEPYTEGFLQPASYDLHLGGSFMKFKTDPKLMIDVKEPVTDLMESIELKDGDEIVLEPGEFILAKVEEITGVDDRHVGRLEGKSSLARLGLIIHATAGFLDPGNKLRMTLEMVNHAPLPIKLYVGMKIAQMAFEELDQSVEKPYGYKGLGSKYLGDMSVRESKYYLNMRKESEAKK